MKNYKSRDKKLNKRKNGMRVSGRSVLLLEQIQIQHAIRIKQENLESESESESKKQ